MAMRRVVRVASRGVARIIRIPAMICFQLHCVGTAEPQTGGGPSVSSTTLDGSVSASPSFSGLDADRALLAIDGAERPGPGDGGFLSVRCVPPAVDTEPSAGCSGEGSAPAQFVVRNGCAQNIDAWSVTRPLTCPTCCAEFFVRTIPVGQASTLPAFTSQVWRLRLSDAGPMLVDVPPLGQGTTSVVLQ